MFTYEINSIIETKTMVGDIPCSIFQPKTKTQENFPFVIYYHGWSSCRANQRFIAAVLASFGYLVLLPDAINHGERGLFENYNEAIYKNFMPTIMQNLAEFQMLKNYAIENLNVDKNRIAVSGHSMGGYTAAGIFTHNAEVKTTVVFNGAFDWQNAIAETEKRYNEKHIELSQTEKKADPACNIEKIIDRPVFILHGNKDTLVPFEVQETFYQKIRERYADKTKIKFTEVDRMNHYISVKMFDAAIIWLSNVL